jgi:hypothetical protein
MPNPTSENPLANSLRGQGAKQRKDSTLLHLRLTLTFPRNPCSRIMTPEGNDMITNSLLMRTSRISLPFLMKAKSIRTSPMLLPEMMTTVKMLENIKGKPEIMMSLWQTLTLIIGINLQELTMPKETTLLVHISLIYLPKMSKISNQIREATSIQSTLVVGLLLRITLDSRRSNIL